MGVCVLSRVSVSGVSESRVFVRIRACARTGLVGIAMSIAAVIGLTGCDSTPKYPTRYSTARAGIDRARFLQTHNDRLSGEQKRLIRSLPYSSNRSLHAANMERVLQGPVGVRVSGGKLEPGRRSLLGMQQGELGQRKGVRIIEIGPTPMEGEDVSPVEKQGNADRPDSEESGEDPTSDSSAQRGGNPR